MYQFLLWGILAALFAYFSQYKGHEKLLYVTYAILVLVIGFQDGIGHDYHGYVQGAYLIETNKVIGKLFYDPNQNTVEFGWFLLCKYIYPIFNSLVPITILEALLLCFAIHSLFKHINKKYLWIGILSFYFIPNFLIFSLSAIRQSFAIPLFVLFCLSLYEKKYLRSLLYILLAYSFHWSVIYSALAILLIMLFSLFLKRKGYVAFAVVCFSMLVFSFFYIDTLAETLNLYSESLLESTKYEHYMDQMSFFDYGTISLRNIVNIVSLVLLVFYINERKESLFFVLSTLVYLALSFAFSMGDLYRGILYLGFFYIPTVVILVGSIKGAVMRNAFISFLLLFFFYCFYVQSNASSLTSTPIRYYHTIFF